MAKKTLFWWITSLLLILSFYALTVNVLMPVLMKNPLPEAHMQLPEVIVEKKSKNKKEVSKEPIEVTPEIHSSGNLKEELLKLFELKKRATLLKSRYDLSSEDSIYLVLDLIDRSASLEIKGVSMHKCNIVDFTVSNSIKMFHTESLLHWMVKPFLLKSAEATIEKIPIVVKIAPKDTTEANKAESTPTPPQRDDVYIVMNFDRNLQLTIDQAERSDGNGKKNVRNLKWKYRKEELKKSLKALITINRDPAKPQINLVLSKADATILYRALPHKPKLVLRM